MGQMKGTLKMSAAEWIRTVILVVAFVGGGLFAYKNLEAQVGVNTRDINHLNQGLAEERTRSQAVDKESDARGRKMVDSVGEMAIALGKVETQVSSMSRQVTELVQEIRELRSE